MRVGLDTFTIRDLGLDPHSTLEWIKERRLEGAQFGGLSSLSPALDAAELQDVRRHADDLGLYSHVSMPICNPHQVRGQIEEHRTALCEQIALAAQCGWHELHTVLGSGEERYRDAVPWSRQLSDSMEFIRGLAPVLRQHTSRLCIETHGDVSTFELVRIVESVGPDVVGICLDTANLFCQCEDPVEGAKRAAPYTHLTHIKDGMIVLTETGYRRQSLPPGRGVIDWRTLLPILAAHHPNLPLSIEDHKWLFDFHVFDPHWLRLHPDLTLTEFASVMRTAWRCTQAVANGDLPDPEVCERVPYADELEERVAAGRDFLNAMLDALDLQDRPGIPRDYRQLGMRPAP